MKIVIHHTMVALYKTEKRRLKNLSKQSDYGNRCELLNDKVIQKTLTSHNFSINLSFLFIRSSLGNSKLKWYRESFIRLVFDVDLNSFIRKRVTVKSNDLISLTLREKHSKPYNKIVRHLLFTSSSMTTSEAVLPISPKMALIDP